VKEGVRKQRIDGWKEKKKLKKNLRFIDPHFGKI
jgi:hypothetical protein